MNDKVKGLKLGADDYMTKPFQIIELLARVESVLRRYHKVSQIIKSGNIEINMRSRIVKCNGNTVELTCKEFDLLLLFMQNQNIALYRENIYERVWGGELPQGCRTIDLHVQRLKKKLFLEDSIETIYKVGYRFKGGV